MQSERNYSGTKRGKVVKYSWHCVAHVQIHCVLRVEVNVRELRYRSIVRGIVRGVMKGIV